MKAQDLVEHLQLIKHPEGGFYRETYRSEVELEFEGFSGKRNLATAIYFLMLGGQSTLPHRIKSDELWYYQLGGPCEIIELDNDGTERIIRLGPAIDKGETLQHVVKAGTWFFSRVMGDYEYSLAACHVNPGFDFKDFELIKS